MSFFNPAIRALRAIPSICRACPRCVLNKPKNAAFYARSITTSSPSTRPHHPEAERRAYCKKHSAYAAAGLIASATALWVIATTVDFPPKETKLDSPLADDPSVDRRRDDPLVAIGKERKAVVQRLGDDASGQKDQVRTGTSTVPFFPKLLGFVDGSGALALGAGTIEEVLTEYQLVGLGVRTVTFLGIQVYVVGMYVATDDIAALQQALIRRIDPIATTLVAGEKEKLKSALLHPEQNDEIWNRVLKDAGVRTILRVVPTKDTDFGHLRDGWVRAITSRARKDPTEFGDEAFGASVKDFKALFRKGSVPKKKELLLARNEKGVLVVWFDDDKDGTQRLGQAQDERISRAIWLNYLAGKKVASEPARLSIVEGVMEFVERPIGTVATQIHV